MSEIIYESWSSLSPILHKKYESEDWLPNIINYLKFRYFPIKNRMLDTMRFIDVHPLNASTFSYEYSSLLRDLGSVFGSVMDSFIRAISHDTKKQYDIRDYRKILVDEVENLEDISMQLNAGYHKRFLEPFRGFSDDSQRIPWWDAYNKVKHTDIKSANYGCQSNVLYGYVTLTAIFELFVGRYYGVQIFESGFYSKLRIDRKTFEKEYVFPILKIEEEHIMRF